MTEETRRKIYRMIARLDLFLLSLSTTLLYFAASVLLAIAGWMYWRESRLGAAVLWACGSVTAALGVIEWRDGRK